MSLGVSGLYLPGFPCSPPLPIDWRQVEGEAESVCLQVTVVERLMQKTLASVHRNILRLVRVSLDMETISCLHSNGFLHAFSLLLCFVSTARLRGSVDVPTLLVEVTQVREVATAAEAS
jgi:hypothetical protein